MTLLIESSWTIVVAHSGTPIPYTFKPKSVRVSRRKQNTVYCSGTVVVAPVPDDVFAQLDVSTFQLKCTVTASQVRDGVPQADESFSLIVYGRERGEDGEVTLLVASEEVIADARTLVASAAEEHGSDNGVWVGVPPIGSSARGVVDEVLFQFLNGTSLASTLYDAEATIGRRLELVQRIKNPFMGIVDTSMWSVRTNVSSIGQPSDYLTYTASGGDARIQYSPRIRYTKGKAYYFQAFMYSQTTARRKGVYLVFYNSDGVVISSIGELGVSTSNQWNRRAIFVAPWEVPADTVEIQPILVTAAAASGNVTRATCFAMYELPADIITSAPGDPITRYRIQGWNHLVDNGEGGLIIGEEGGMASIDEMIDCISDVQWHEPTTVGSIVGYDEIVDAGDLSGIRPTVEIDIFATIMKPGQTVREFLDPLINLSGGRLFHRCETDDWVFVTDAYTSGELPVDLVDVTLEREDHVDVTETVDGVPTIFTGVVLVYDTIDPLTGLQRTYVDQAGDTTGNVLVRRFRNEPYPGAGAAADILNRAAARLARITVTAVADWTAKPSRGATFMLDGIEYEGIISSVDHYWSKEGNTDTMTIVVDDCVPIGS